MISGLYKFLRVYNDAKSLAQGPKAVVKRQGRKVAMRGTQSVLRRLGL